MQILSLFPSHVGVIQFHVWHRPHDLRARVAGADKTVARFARSLYGGISNLGCEVCAGSKGCDFVCVPPATDRQIETEDLPAPSLAQMAESLGVPSVDFATPPEHALIRGHSVAGNVSRPDPVRSISPDETRREYLGISGQMSMYLLVRPLMIRCRYRL